MKASFFTGKLSRILGVAVHIWTYRTTIGIVSRVRSNVKKVKKSLKLIENTSIILYIFCQEFSALRKLILFPRGEIGPYTHVCTNITG